MSLCLNISSIYQKRPEFQKNHSFYIYYFFISIHFTLFRESAIIALHEKLDHQQKLSERLMKKGTIILREKLF